MIWSVCVCVCARVCVFIFLGGTLWSSGFCPGLCSKETAVWKQRRQWSRPAVSYTSVQSSGPLKTSLFVSYSNHLFAFYRHQVTLRPAFTQMSLCSQEVKTLQRYQKKVSCSSHSWHPLEGWREKTSHSYHVRSRFSPLLPVHSAIHQCSHVTTPRFSKSHERYTALIPPETVSSECLMRLIFQAFMFVLIYLFI